MPRYIVTTRRDQRGKAISASDAVKAEPGITLVNESNSDMVTIEAPEKVAEQLQAKLRDTCYVEPEIHRSLD